MQTINLLPEKYVIREKNRLYKKVFGIGLALELGITAFIALVPLNEIRNKETYLIEIETRFENPKFEEVVTVQEELTAVRKKYDKWYDYLKQMKSNKFINSGLLDTLLGNIPVGVSIDMMSLDEVGQIIEIQGKTTNSYAAMGYISKIQSIYNEADVVFDLGEQENTGKYSVFKIGITFGLDEEQEEAGIEEEQDE